MRRARAAERLLREALAYKDDKAAHLRCKLELLRIKLQLVLDDNRRLRHARRDGDGRLMPISSTRPSLSPHKWPAAASTAAPAQAPAAAPGGELNAAAEWLGSVFTGKFWGERGENES